MTPTSHHVDRRAFIRTLAATGAAAALADSPAARAATPRLKVGHTGITWGFAPADAEPAIVDVGRLGFHGYESFGDVLEAWDKNGGLKRVLDANRLPLRSES